MKTIINKGWQNKILILFAPPMIHRSNVNKSLINSVMGLENITVHDLYASYPDFDIDIKQEQSLLYEHDIIIFQYPFYWYSTPAILKAWQDLVLQYGFAYGENGNALAEKHFMNITTVGATKGSYTSNGTNRYSVKEFLYPIEQTARFVGMNVIPPYMIYGTHRIRKSELDNQVSAYQELLVALRDNKSCEHLETNKGTWSNLLAKLTGQRNG